MERSAKAGPVVDGFVYPSKATQAGRRVGSLSIFMKLAPCEIGFCLMDPCMTAPLKRHWSHENGEMKRATELERDNRRS